MTAWLDVIGIGEDGWDGLSSVAQARLASAEIIIGGARHHALAPHLTAERINWPSPFRALVDEIGALRGRRVAVLVTGDPLWFSVGGHLARKFPASDITFHPQISAFQWAAARMRWSLADVETLTVHGRPAEQVIPYVTPSACLLVLTQDAATPPAIARLLTDLGFGDSRMTVLGALGGSDESRIDGIAREWSAAAPDFHTLAIECIADADARCLPLTGLPDDAFEHDGLMTKSEIRALTLSALAPRRGQHLWDIGTGCGSVAIEWMRAARDTTATGIDNNADRLAMAATNAARLGAPRLQLSEKTLPDGLADLPAPHAVFIGGGLSEAVVDIALGALRPHGRLVANAVTLESEARLAQFQAQHGGTLIRVAVSRAAAVGAYRGWRPMMPVTQWSLTR